MPSSPFDIAVITPTFNRAALLPTALDSVLAQTHPGRIEVAVVDDGSTDDTDQVMAGYLQRHGDESAKVVIRHIKLAKAGVVTARNTALAATSAPLVAILDSDDYWTPTKLARQAAQFDDPAVVLSHTGFIYVNERGEPTDGGPQRLDNPLVGDCLDVLLDEFLVIFSSAVMRRSAIDAAAAMEPHGQPFDPRWTNAQDYDLVLRVATQGRFAYVPEPLTCYRLHSQHGAMGNLKRAFGFHCRVQIDFARRHGARHGISVAQAQRRAGQFLANRAESAFWQRRFDTAGDLCDLADELDITGPRFTALRRQLSRPVWMYRLKDWLDRLRRRS